MLKQNTSNLKYDDHNDGGEYESDDMNKTNINSNNDDNFGDSIDSVDIISDLYEKIDKIGEGTYGEVFRAVDKKTKERVALKQVKVENEKEGVYLFYLFIFILLYLSFLLLQLEKLNFLNFLSILLLSNSKIFYEKIVFINIFNIPTPIFGL
jgi:serine/threonine protein kinase